MASPRRLAIALGGIFWAGVIGSAVMASLDSRSPKTDRALDAPAAAIAHPDPRDQVWDYFSQSRTVVELKLPEIPARDGDPIFAQGSDGRWIQTGYITETNSRRSATRGQAIWYAAHLDPAEYRFEYHQNRGKFDDVMRTLLPPEKREQVEQLVRQAIEQNGREIAEAMRPVVTRAMRKSAPVVERALKQSLRRHRDELAALGERYREEVLNDRLLPLIREEILPIVRKHGEPLAHQIGRELWDRASLWRFGWRAFYDSSPLPERDLVREEWERFVENEALPVLESHREDLVQVQREIFVDISRSERVRNELRDVATSISTDKELQRLLTIILRETIVDNRELREVWTDTWKSAEAKAALKLAGDRLEPVVREIGDELFGTRDGGISPSFARVLRNQVLGKDRRWIMAIHDPRSGPEGGPKEVHIARDWRSFPLTILASPDEPL